jgi:arylsulfatase A-like enzyme/Flp pilus assembly protein TadD
VPRQRTPRSAKRHARFLAVTAAFGLIAAVVWWWLPAAEPVRREAGLNVLLITIDTLRADAIGAYGNPRARTPWIDRLAAGGVRFTEARAHNVVTLPSHANILSGRYPFDHGARDNAGFRFPHTLDTLATLLAGRGYRTGAFVSAFPLDSRFGLERGFEVYDDSFVGADAQPAFLIQERAASETVARARAWLDAPDPRPSFCWVHLYEPHFPYPNGYDADVSAADAALAPLLERVVGGSDERTLVMLTSDHGESLGDHGESTHGIFAYEATLRVPLVMHQRRLLRPRIVGEPARHIDILPTVLDALAIPPPTGLPGRSLLPGSGENPDLPVTTYFEALSGELNRGWAPLTGVIRGSMKYIKLPIPEVYDLAADPAEGRNLATLRNDIVDEFDAMLASIRPGRDEVVRTAESEDTLARLRSLGYVAAARTARAPRLHGEDDDPKRLMSLDALLQEVVGRYLDGDLTGALERCRELVRQRPSMAVSLLHLAHLERANGNLEGGIAALKKAAALMPGDSTTVSLLGAYLGEAGRSNEAMAWLEGVAHRSDADPQVLVTYGLALAKLGRHDAARVAFDRAVAQDPSSPRLLVERGTAHIMAGRRDLARADFTAAVERRPDIARAHTSLGVLALEDGKPDAAIAHWRAAVTHDYREHQAILALGVFHWRAGRREAAHAYLDFFLATAPPARYARELAMVRDLRRTR